MQPTFNNAAGLVTSQAPLPSLALHVIIVRRWTRSRSGCSGHGWTERWPVPVAIDPGRVKSLVRTKCREHNSSKLHFRMHKEHAATIDDGVWQFSVVPLATSSNGSNRHERPRRRQSASACVADRHPILAHGLDDRWDIGVGVAQKFFGLGALSCRSEQRMPLVVHTVQQDGQQ